MRVVRSHAWAASTQEVYGTGLLLFHVYCDSKGVPEEERAPANSHLIQAFIATIAGAYAGTSIVNYVCGIRAWHVLHGVPWIMDKHQTDAILKGASSLAPASSTRAKREPVSVAMITAIREQLDMANPLHAAVFACLTTAFWGAARIGELTITKLMEFDPTKHVKRSDVRQETDRNNLKTTVFAIPRTKTNANGEDIFWAKQDSPADPEAAWINHMNTNPLPPTDHLFAYKHKSGTRPLTRHTFIRTLNEALKKAGQKPMQGHGIRIGATLEYLLRGMPFEVMKLKGRWASDAFERYLTKHAQIMAPYMQAVPATHETFVRYTMPAPR
jgi:hypothetical protein